MSARGRRFSTALFAAAVTGGMLGLSFAAVPLYRLFCAKTGYGGTTQVAKAAPAARGTRTFTVRFDNNVASGLPWQFAPETPGIRLRTGETATVFYKVTNLSDAPTTGIASYNVSPDQAGSYFNKLACFCFSEQHLGTARDGGMAGRVLPRSGAGDGRDDAAGRRRDAVLHVLRAQGRPGPGRGGHGGAGAQGVESRGFPACVNWSRTKSARGR